MDKEYSIRFAQNTDLEAILGLVRELAVFEKEPEAVTATLEDYHRAWESRLIHSQVAEVGGEIVGMVLYYDTFSTWRGKMLYLEDFYVKPSHRGKGIGQALFDATLRAAKDRGCVMMKWQVLDWNEGAIRFYERNMATIEREWWNGKIVF